MYIEHRFFKRRHSLFGRALAVTGALLALAVAAQAVLASGTQVRAAALDSRVQAIMDGAPYQHATWGLLQVDPTTDQVVHAVNPDTLFIPGSTAKLFSVSATWATLGPDYRFTTPVYAVGTLSGDTLVGNLVLVGSGDLDLGGRTTADGRVDYVGEIDHTDANAAGSDSSILIPEDPLSGVDELARQVHAAGITHVQGDVLMDARLFQPFTEIEPTPTPIMLNDNVIDVVTSPGQAGQPAAATLRPQVGPYHVAVNASTVAAGGQTHLEVSLGPDDTITVSGQIAADAKPQLRTVSVGDPDSFARTAFIEALGRAGVSVSATPTAPNSDAELPSATVYAQSPRVAELTSPPYSAYATMILKMSHNLGANLGLCLMAVHAGSTDCAQGLAIMQSFLASAGVDPSQVAQADGRGGSTVDVATPRAVVQLLRYWLTRPDAAELRATLPILGVDGSLAFSGEDSPARGKVLAKTGTFIAFDPLNQRLITQGKALAGYLVMPDGSLEVFDVVVNQAPVADFAGAVGIGDDLTRIAAMLQQGSR